jgi:hypothetical protein
MMNFFHAVASAGRVGTTPLLPIVTSNLIGYWDAKPANQGFPWPDISSTYNPSNTQNHPLSASNSPIFTTAGGADCLYLNGSLQSVQWVNAVYGTADLFRPILNPQFTEEFWIRSNGAWLSNGQIFNAGFNTGTRTRITTPTSVWSYNVGMNSGVTLGTGFATNTWWHICFTMRNLGTNDEFLIYRNGVVVGSDLNGNYNPTYTNPNYYLGVFSGSEYQRIYFGLGRKYNRALTAAEVLQNFDSEKARFGY